MVRILVSVLVSSLVVSGCVSQPPIATTSAEGPVSQRAVVGDATQRARAHVDLGFSYLQANKLDIALSEAKIAIESDPSYPLGYNLQGLVQMYLNENRAAEQSFSRALQLAPGDPEISNNFGWFLCLAGRERAALPYFEAAAGNPLYLTPTKPLTNAAMCLIGVKDDQGGEDFLLRALKADPKNYDAQFVLAGLYYRSGRLLEAKQQLDERHRHVDPTAQSAWLGLRLERKLGDREAEQRYNIIIRRNFPRSREHDLLMQGNFE